MSTSSVVINQNVELLKVLCRQTLTFNAILGKLQTSYPLTGWSDELLNERLNQGFKEGRIQFVGYDLSNPSGYQINQNMLQLNGPRNMVYACFCSNMYPVNLSVPGVTSY